MNDILAKSFYGNDIKSWAVFFIAIICSIAVSKIFYLVIAKFIKGATSKTKTDLDDILVDQLEDALVMSISLFGIRCSFLLINLSEKLHLILTSTINVSLTCVIGWAIYRTFNRLVNEFLDPLAKNTVTELDDQILIVTKKAMNLIIISLTILLAISNAGGDIGALIATLGIGGLAFALAAQDTISNLFGGVTIIADKPFKINDRVEVHGFDGFIVDIGLRSTRLRTIGENRIVTIPNSKFTSDGIKNITSEPARTIELDLGLTYDTTVEKMDLAMEILENIIKNNDNTEEEPIISFDAFNDFSLNIKFRYYIKLGQDFFKVQTEINREILGQFNENKLDFAFPTQTILAEVTNK